ncbi:MAG TPA: hypothetical protein PLF26_12705 [Blastocatellia bacterium]|nr:hypothetical protein [Blastocatellia bacterium]
MKKLSLSVTLALVAICLGVAATTYADIAQPPAPKQEPPIPRAKENTVKLVIETGYSGQEAQLWLPSGWYAGQSPGVGSIAPQSGGLSQLNTIVTGTALSLAIVFGGFWLVRSRRELGTRNTATAAVILVVLASTASFALANAAPPRNYKPADPGTLRLASPTGEQLTGTVRYYYGTNDGEARLVLPAKKAE